MAAKKTNKAPEKAEPQETTMENTPTATAELIAPTDLLNSEPPKIAEPGGNGAATPVTSEDLLSGIEPGTPATAPDSAPPSVPGLGEAPDPTPLPDSRSVDTGAGKRKRGRPPGSRNKKPGDILPDGTVNFADIDSIANVGDLTPEAAATDYQALAEMSFDMGTSSLAVVFSDDWKPKSDSERMAVVAALKRYFEHKQVKDIPPGALLAIVLCAYAAPRFNTPTTKDKLKMAWTWFKSKISRKKA